MIHRARFKPSLLVALSDTAGSMIARLECAEMRAFARFCAARAGWRQNEAKRPRVIIIRARAIAADVPGVLY